MTGRPRASDTNPETGLSCRQDAALRAIARLTAQGGPTTLRAVGEILGVWGRAVEGLVHRLQAKGLIDRHKGTHPVGGTLRLTEAGHAVMKGSHAATSP
jgi:Mn-dependent DtxR family transcriptional regulator